MSKKGAETGRIQQSDSRDQHYQRDDLHMAMRDKHGVQVLDPILQDSDFEALFAARIDHPMAPYVDPAHEQQEQEEIRARAEAWRKTTDALEQEFITLRDDMARRSRRRYLSGNSERPFTDEDIEKFVRETATHDSNGHDWYRSAMPNNRFFRDNMLPTLRALAQTPEELNAVAHTAFDALHRLLIWDRSGSSCGRTPEYMPKIFFNQNDQEETWGRGGHQGAGQFAYFHKKYGPGYALAVSQLQGWLSDEHYEGGNSYCISSREIERRLNGLWENCPPQLRNRCMRIYANICAKNHYWGDAFAHEFPKVLKHFSDHGKSHLIETLLDIASLDLNINLDSFLHRDTVDVSHINIFSPEDMIRECEGLDVNPYKRELLVYAQSIVQHSMGGVSSQGDVSFVRSKETAERRKKRWKKNMMDQVAELEEAGCSQEDIRAILTLEESHPWLGESAHLIIEEWLNIEKKFPGGTKGLIEYCAKLQPKDDCIKFCVLAVRSADVVPSANSPYWNLGIEVTTKLGNAAVSFFEREAMQGVAKREKRIKNERNSKEALWEKHVRRAVELASSFPKSPTQGTDGRKKIFSWALPESMNRYGENIPPKDLKKALAILKTAWLAHAEAHKEEVGWRLKYFYDAILESFEAIYRANEVWREKNSDAAKDPGVMPPIEDIARHAVFLTLEVGDSHGTLAHDYAGNVDEGCSPYVAMMMTIFGKNMQHLNGVDLRKLAVPEELRPKVAEYQRIFDTTRAIRARLAAVYEARGNDDIGWHQKRLARLPREKAQAMIHIPDSGKALRSDLATIKKLKEDPETKGMRADFEKLEEELTTAINMTSMRDVIRFAVHTGEFHLDQSEFFHGTNDSTRLAISGTALLMALGGTGVKMDKSALESLPDLRDTRGSFPISERIAQMRGGRFLDTLIRNMKTTLPLVERHVREHRELAVGMMPMGAKIHTPREMNAEMLQVLQMVFELRTSPFHLIHAGETLLLEPLPTTTELKMLIHLLEAFGSVDAATRQLQTTMGGRLESDGAAIVGSSILLSTPTGISYEPGAFQTTHDETGARFMAYDAGIKKEGLPFDIQKAKGRTDVLGRRAPEDLDIHKVVGTLVTHAQFGGPFASLVPEFQKGFEYILRRHGLDRALRESAWVFDHAQEGDSLAAHEAMIRRFTDTWMDAERQIDYGVIREMGGLITDTANRMREAQPRIRVEQSDDYANLRHY